MKTLKAIAIDDEPDALDVLEMLLSEHKDQVELIATSNSAVEGFKLIQKHQPDLVFLDIEMTEMTGLDLVEMIEERNFHLIFVTAYEHYALKALKAKADDYLLKPVNPIELEKTIKEIYQSFLISEKDFNFEENKIALPSNDGYIFVEIQEIDHIEACDNYSYVFTSDGQKKLICRRLKQFDEALKNHGFLRVHRSFIVNTDRIESYSRADGGYLITKSDKTIYLPRRNKDEIIEVLKKKAISV